MFKKREAYREAFDGFDPAKAAIYDEEKVEELVATQASSATARRSMPP